MLERIVTELDKAISTGNKNVWQEYMADDGIMVNRDGKTYSKEELVKEIAPKGKGVVLNIVPQNMKWYLTGNSAMVSFLADEKLSIHGQRVDTKYPSVMYFEKRNGNWKLLFFTYFEQPIDPPGVTVSREYLKKFTGVYKVSDELKVVVTDSDSGLVYKKSGSTGAGTVLYPIDRDGRFFRKETESEFIFNHDEHGRSVMRQRRNWIDLIWYKE